jgi:predicted ATP-dependent Lon-type protease
LGRLYYFVVVNKAVTSNLLLFVLGKFVYNKNQRIILKGRENVKEFLNDRLLRRSIEAHKKIITEGEVVDLASIGYEDGTLLDRVHGYNAFTILTKLSFNGDEVVNPKSESAKHLDELAFFRSQR